MAQRTESLDSLDDFPTPKWATRALIEEVFADEDFSTLSCWEPTCGRGYMASALGEYFGTVRSSDIHDYGYGEIFDFLSLSADASTSQDCPDWIVTNPPFRLGEEFVRRALQFAKSGVAMLVRTGFIEGAGRYERLFKDRPPSCVAQFVERVPILRGRVDPRASTATGYCWLIWQTGSIGSARLAWIPPCRRRLEKAGDYEPSLSQGTTQAC